MDHYCPFVLNTVGHHNHGMFILLCFYHTLGIGIGLAGFSVWLWRNYMPLMRAMGLLGKMLITGFLVFDGAVVVMMWSFTSYMLMYNIKFVVENQTTVEWYEDKDQRSTQGHRATGRIRGNLYFHFHSL